MSSNSTAAIIGTIITVATAAATAAAVCGAIPGVKGQMGFFGPTLRGNDGRYMNEGAVLLTALIHLGGEAVSSIGSAGSWIADGVSGLLSSSKVA